jgi:hypothetical protein
MKPPVDIPAVSSFVSNGQALPETGEVDSASRRDARCDLHLTHDWTGVTLDDQGTSDGGIMQPPMVQHAKSLDQGHWWLIPVQGGRTPRSPCLRCARAGCLARTRPTVPSDIAPHWQGGMNQAEAEFAASAAQRGWGTVAFPVPVVALCSHLGSRV